MKNVFVLIVFSCSGPESDQPILTAEVPLHLEEHMETAIVTASEVSEDLPQSVLWSFEEEQMEWKVLPLGDKIEPTKVSRTDDALRMTLGRRKEEKAKWAAGALYVDVPSMCVDDTIHHSQPEAHSLTRLLRAEERIKDLGEVLLGNPRARVPDLEGQRGFRWLVSCANNNRASAGRGLGCIQYEVDQDLLDLGAVTVNLWKVVSKLQI